jgi:hypothetical protein
MILFQDSSSWMASYIIKVYFISQMIHVDFKFLSLVMTFLLQDILASIKPWNLNSVIFGGHIFEKPLRIMLQHVIYVPFPRHMSYYAHCQFRRNLGLQYL